MFCVKRKHSGTWWHFCSLDLWDHAPLEEHPPISKWTDLTLLKSLKPSDQSLLFHCIIPQTIKRQYQINIHHAPARDFSLWGRPTCLLVWSRQALGRIWLTEHRGLEMSPRWKLSKASLYVTYTPPPPNPTRLALKPVSEISGASTPPPWPLGDTALPSCDVSDNARAGLPFQCYAHPLDGPFVEGFPKWSLHIIRSKMPPPRRRWLPARLCFRGSSRRCTK